MARENRQRNPGIISWVPAIKYTLHLIICSLLFHTILPHATIMIKWNAVTLWVNSSLLADNWNEYYRMDEVVSDHEIQLAELQGELAKIEMEKEKFDLKNMRSWALNR